MSDLIKKTEKQTKTCKLDEKVVQPLAVFDSKIKKGKCTDAKTLVKDKLGRRQTE